MQSCFSHNSECLLVEQVCTDRYDKFWIYSPFLGQTCPPSWYNGYGNQENVMAEHGARVRVEVMASLTLVVLFRAVLGLETHEM